MPLPWPVTAALGLMAVGLAIAWWRGRATVALLREALDAKSADLEHLQVSFARFAPEEIVERVVAGGVFTRGERKEATADRHRDEHCHTPERETSGDDALFERCADPGPTSGGRLRPGTAGGCNYASGDEKRHRRLWSVQPMTFP